jgi:preprotein translocase subunit YajC
VTGTRAVTFYAPGTGLHGIADSIADNTVTLQLNDEQRGNLRAALNADARIRDPPG